MDSKEYKRILSEENILDYGALEATRKELERLGETNIANEILRVLADNKIEKPLFHFQKENQWTNFYKIDLSFEEIDTIVSMFGDLEVGALGVDYETTKAAAFYGSMLDKWSNLQIYK